MRAAGYYWVRIEGTWYVAKYDAENINWYLPTDCGSLTDESEFSEIDERQIVRDIVNLNKGIDIMNIRFKAKEGDGFELIPTSVFFHEKGADITCVYENPVNISQLADTDRLPEYDCTEDYGEGEDVWYKGELRFATGINSL